MKQYRKKFGQQKNHLLTTQLAAQAEQYNSSQVTKRVPTVHRAYVALATVALAAVLLLSLAGCQTPTQPTYNGAMVPPPPTGAIGQPAPYGPVGAPQVSYAQTPMPGPASTWQGATPPPTGYPPPAAPVQPGTQPPPAAAGSTWNWSQSQPPAGAPPAAGQPPIAPYNGATAPPPTAQQPPPTYNANPAYGTPPPAGYQQPAPGQPAPGQPAPGQPQQWTGQYPQGAPQAPQQQTTNGSWWPFSDPNVVPPARATPASVPRY